MQFTFDSPDSLLASFLSGTESGRLIFVSGPSGSGKTGWCTSLVERAGKQAIKVGGVFSPPVFEGGIKTAIDLVDVESHDRRQLAARRGVGSGSITTDEWQFNDETLEWGNQLIGEAASCPLFILDELGPLELERGSGLTRGVGVLSARSYRLACAVIRPSLLQTARSLWPWGQVLMVGSGPDRKGGS